MFEKKGKCLRNKYLLSFYIFTYSNIVINFFLNFSLNFLNFTDLAQYKYYGRLLCPAQVFCLKYQDLTIQSNTLILLAASSIFIIIFLFLIIERSAWDQICLGIIQDAAISAPDTDLIIIFYHIVKGLLTKFAFEAILLTYTYIDNTRLPCLNNDNRKQHNFDVSYAVRENCIQKLTVCHLLGCYRFFKYIFVDAVFSST